jgi:predicted ribosome quality control (RQC) complex YloA/Tae2 family protein
MKDTLKKKEPQSSRQQTGTNLPPSPWRLQDADGYRILIGRNNRQNDLVTMRLARNDDLWLHAKDIPGSHVIIQLQNNTRFSETVIARAAGLAAYFSRARQGLKVPVDYTLRKFVRKPRGAKPGMVIYDHQKTILAAPLDPETIKR